MKRQNRTTTTTTVKNPNWPETNQLATYKCSWEVEPGTTRIKFNEWLERVLNLGSPDLKASAPTTGPHCLLSKTDGKGITTFFPRTADFSVWCSITNAPGCCGLLVFTFRVNISWDTRGSDLLTFRPSGIDVTLFK